MQLTCEIGVAVWECSQVHIIFLLVLISFVIVRLLPVDIDRIAPNHSIAVQLTRAVMSRLVACVLLLALVAMAAASASVSVSAASVQQLQRTMAAQEQAQSRDSDAVGTERLSELQAQVSSVTQQLDGFLTAHSGDSGLLQLDHEQVQRVQEKLAALQATHAEIEARHAAETAEQHAALMQLVDQQKAQQQMITDSIERTRRLESQLADMRAQADQRDNQAAYAEELDQQQHQGNDMVDHTDGSFIEMHTDMQQAPHWIEWEADHAAAEVDDQWAPEALLEADSEHSLGAMAAAHTDSPWDAPRPRTRGLPDPVSFSSSADYMAAMGSVDRAVNMSPQQLHQLQEQMHGHADAGAAPRGRRSMADIDSLVAEGASELQSAQQPEFHFDPSQLRTPGLQSALGSLQDEDAIQSAMLRAQDKIRAIAAELERHQQANGEHPAGIEIEMEEIGMDEPTHFQ